MRWLVTQTGAEDKFDIAQVKKALTDKSGPLWLDVQAPTAADYELLQSAFGIHELTIEDMRHGHQRPKWEDYPGYVFLVLISVYWKKRKLVLHQHNLCIAPSWVITVHQEVNPELAGLRKRLGIDSSLTQGNSMFLSYLVTDAIVDCTFPVLDAIDMDVDALEDRLVTTASQPDLAEITNLKHSVSDLRRTLGAQRDALQRLVTQSLQPGQDDSALYFRDVYDHLVRQYETVDSLRDLLSGAMDTYLSTVSNRLNGTMKTLTVMASLFLPLTFLTGFFGMNFAYLTGVVQPSDLAFFGGIALMIGSLAIQLYLFRERGWI
ncbi:MAG: magnesium transporter CorA family protein [Candidatus Dormibacteria bacterium]|jgi:magnesium transporter